MMCPTGRLPAASCSALVLLACRSLIRLAPRPVVRVVPLLSVSLLVSSCRLVLSCLLIGHVRLVSSAHPLRSACSPCLSCRRAGRHHLASISSCVSPAAPVCLLTALRSTRSRVAVADVIASLMRSVATVPPLPRLACAVGCFSRHVCAILCAVAMGTIG